MEMEYNQKIPWIVVQSNAFLFTSIIVSKNASKNASKECIIIILFSSWRKGDWNMYSIEGFRWRNVSIYNVSLFSSCRKRDWNTYSIEEFRWRKVSIYNVFRSNFQPEETRLFWAFLIFSFQEDNLYTVNSRISVKIGDIPFSPLLRGFMLV